MKKETVCQSIIIEKNILSAEISFYIHALPYLTGIASYSAKYPWSSLFCYCSRTKNPPWLETGCILSQTSTRYLTAYKDYRFKFNSFLIDPSNFLMDNLIAAIEDTKIIGSKKFKHIITQTAPDKLPFKNIKTISAEKITEIVEEKLKYNKQGKRLAKIYLTYLYSAMTNRKAGEFFGNISSSRITHIVKQTRIKMKKDENFKSLINKLKNILKNNKNG
ncbi:hypothetical protein J7L67_07940 [bacterium]|nr:hypothetical protein [bacterium]